MSVKVEGRVETDVRQALAGIRQVGRELAGLTRQSTTVKINADATGAKTAAHSAQTAVAESARAQAKAVAESARAQQRAMEESARAQRAALAQTVAAGRQAAGQLATNFARVARVGGLAIAGAFGASLKVLDDYDRKMRNVNSIAQLGARDFDKLSESVRKISADPNIKKGPRDLAEGLYDVYSAGYKGAEALDILRESAKSASAGVSSTKVGVDAITTALRAQIPGVNTARQAADGYFQTVNDGKISFSQLSSAIGKSAAILKAGGVSFQEYGAYMADATLKGNKSAAATIALNNLVNKLGAPPVRAAKAFNEMGIKFGYAELKAVGFTAKMKEVLEKTNGNADALRRLFPDQRAFMAALNITSGQMGSYNRLLENQKNAHEGAGAAARAAAKQNQGLSNSVDQAKKNLELFALTAAGVVAPSVSHLLDYGTRLLRNFQTLPKATQDNYVKMVALAGGALLLVKPLKGLIETGLLVSKVVRGISAAMEAARAAKLASAAASAELAAAEGAAGTGAAGAAASVGAFGAAFVALAAVAVIATVAIGAYKIHQENVKKANIDLRDSNSDVIQSNKLVAKSFDELRKSAKVEAGASKTVSDLAAQYDKLKDSAKGIATFKGVALPKARREIAVNVHLTMPQKAELNREIDAVANRIDTRMQAKKFNVAIKAEADKGALQEAKEAFYGTYGELYEGLRSVFLIPSAEDWKNFWGTAKTAASSAGSSIKEQWNGMVSEIDAATNGAASRMASAFQGALNKIGKAIAGFVSDKLSQFGRWIQGQSGTYGETSGPAKAADPRATAILQDGKAGIKAEKSAVWLGLHPGYGADGKKFDGSHAGGLARVPKDGYIAELHKDEAVLTASQAADWRARAGALDSSVRGLESRIDDRVISRANAGKRGTDAELLAWRRELRDLKRELSDVKREGAQAEREGRAHSRAQRAQLRESAKEFKASGDEVQKAAEATIAKLSDLRDGFKGMLGEVQSELLGLGVTNDPLGGLTRSFERLLQIGKQARKAAKDGKTAVDAFNASIPQSTPVANIGGESGGAGAQAAPQSGGAGIGRAKSLFEQFNLQSRVDMTCADVASATIGALGYHLKREAGAGRLEAQVKALGWARVDPRSAPLGAAVFKDSPSARSGVHAMMGMGDGRLASSSNHKVSYFNARGSERAYAPVGAGGAALAMPDFGGGGNAAPSVSRIELSQTVRDVLSGAVGFGLGSMKPLGRGWGGAVRPGEGNAARVAMQTRIGSGGAENQIAALSAILSDPTRKADVAKFTKETGIKPRWEQGWTRRDQSVDVLRQLANLEDARTNAIKAGLEKEDKRTALLKEQIASVKEARAQVKATSSGEADETGIARKQNEFLARGGGLSELDAYTERLQKVMSLWRDESSPVVKLFKAGRKSEANQAFKDLMTGFDGARERARDLENYKASIQSVGEAMGKLPGLGDVAKEPLEALKTALADGEGSAKDLKAALEALPDALKNLEVAAASNPNLALKFGPILGAIAQARAGVVQRTGKEKIARDKGDVDAIFGDERDALASAGANVAGAQLSYNERDMSDSARLAAQSGRELAALADNLKGATLSPEGAKAATAEYERIAGQWREIVASSQQLEQSQGADKLNGYLGELDGRTQMARIWNPAKSQAAQLRASLTGEGWSDADIQRIIPAERAARQAEEMNNRIGQAMDGMRSDFTQSVRGLASEGLHSFSGMFKGILDHLNEFSTQFLADKAWSGISGLFGNLLGGALGGGGAKVGGFGGGALALPGAAIASIAGGLAGGGHGLKFGGSFKVGLDYVPHDGFVAELHRGEAVLTADEARSWRGGREGGDDSWKRGAASGGGRGEGGGSVNVVHNHFYTIGSVKANNPDQFERQMPGSRQSSAQMKREANRAIAQGGRYN